MNIIEEIENIRQRTIANLNADFDALINRVKSGESITTERKPYDVMYPLMSNAAIFKGKKPLSVIINGETLEVKTWKELVKTVLEKCTESKDNIIRLYELAGHISGKRRILLATTDSNMRSPLEIAKHLYLETHYDTETLLNILTSRILSPIGYDMKNIWVVIRNE